MFKDTLKFALEHPETVDDIQVQFNNKAIPFLIESDIWPEAAYKSLIVDEEKQEQIDIRAKAIINRFIREDMTGKKFLDFGAGNSNCVKFANADVAIAYDVQERDGITTSLDEVKEAGPYDIILIYDVLDHMVINGELATINQLVETMQLMKQLLTNKGVIYIRCHPWTSRNGTHAYLKNNKAFIHYVNGLEGIPTIKIVEPIWTYTQIFNKAGLKITKQTTDTQQVEKLFKDKIFEQWVSHFTWRNRSIYQEVMAINFVDFVLC